jgi:hypothetical protein
MAGQSDGLSIDGPGAPKLEVVSKPPLEPNLCVGEKRLILEIPDVLLRLNVFSPP